MKIRFTPPTDEFPFYSNVSIKTPDGFKVIKEYPADDYVASIVEKTECFMYGDLSLTKPALTLPLSML